MTYPTPFTRIFFVLLHATLFSSSILHAELIDVGGRYLVPRVKSPADFANTRYIDPSAENNGDGSISSPYNTLSGLSFASNTAYLFKAGTTLQEPIDGLSANSYLGRYGEGDNPVIEANCPVLVMATDCTFEGLDLVGIGLGGNNERVLSTGSADSNVTFARCRIRGSDRDGFYPFYLLKGSVPFMMFYECELSHSWDDGLFLSAQPDMAFVSCYFHHNNMSNGTGDTIQLQYQGAHRFYLANNFMDRSHTIWKYGLMTNLAEGEGRTMTEDMVCVWSTFVSPKAGLGGAAVRWCPGIRGLFAKNLVKIKYTPGVAHNPAGIESYPEFDYLDGGYGIRDNHFIGPTGANVFYNFTPASPDNLVFENEAEYAVHLEAQNVRSNGSDLFEAGAETPPTIPQNLNATIELNAVHLSWTASTDDVGIFGYRIFRDGVRVGFSGGTSWTDAGLEFGSTHEYKIVALDPWERPSGFSETVSGTIGLIGDTQAPSVPGSLSALAGTVDCVLSWAPAYDNIQVAGYRIFRDGVEIGVAMGTSYVDSGLTPATRYGYTVIAFDHSGNSSPPVAASAITRSTALPEGWRYDDIGSVTFAGGASQLDGTFSISASGADIGGVADAFGFVHRRMVGDGSIVARVPGLQATDSWAKFGVMFRESLDAGSKNASMVVNPGAAASLQRRPNTNAQAPYGTTQSVGVWPIWVRLTRNGDSFTGEYSTDGNTWNTVASISIPMGEEIQVGLALCSHNNAMLNNSQIDEVQVTSQANFAPTLDIGGDRTVAAGSSIQFIVGASDGDGDEVSISASGP